MDVILLEKIEKLGNIGDIVTVKDGYARNFLLPQEKALRATETNKKVFEEQKADLIAKNDQLRGESMKTGEKIDNLTLVVIRQAGDSGQLYGSVTARDVATLISEAEKVSIDRNSVIIDTPIKTLGLFDVRIRLHPEVSVTVRLNVARSEDEAALQLERGGMITAEQAREEAIEEAPALEEVLENPEQAIEAEETDAEVSEEDKKSDTEAA